MPDSPSETPAAHFDRYLAEVERDPEFQARRDRIRRITERRPLHPFYGGPAVAAVIMAVGLLAHWVGLW